MLYRKLNRTWSHNELNYIPRFRELFPELSNVSSEELCDRFIELNLDFYSENKVPVNFLTRLTLPFAVLTIIAMFIGLPIKFIFTGQWGYSFGKNGFIFNWFRSLGLQ